MPDTAGMYDDFARSFAAHAEDSAWNAHYDRPAVLDLLGDVDGLHVLDAGCGPGLYAEELLRRGARVTAVDGSTVMVELARTRLGDQAVVRHHDLAHRLDWLEDASVDRIVCALVLHHLDDRVASLRELRRVLRPGGHLVVSTTHPTMDWLDRGGSYFDVEAVDDTWHDEWTVRWHRGPLQMWCDEFAAAGLLVERVVEPLPATQMAHTHPDVHERLSRAPGFIAFRLVPAAT